MFHTETESNPWVEIDLGAPGRSAASRSSTAATAAPSARRRWSPRSARIASRGRRSRGARNRSAPGRRASRRGSRVTCGCAPPATRCCTCRRSRCADLIVRCATPVRAPPGGPRGRARSRGPRRPGRPAPARSGVGRQDRRARRHEQPPIADDREEAEHQQPPPIGAPRFEEQQQQQRIGRDQVVVEAGSLHVRRDRERPRERHRQLAAGDGPAHTPDPRRQQGDAHQLP